MSLDDRLRLAREEYRALPPTRPVSLAPPRRRSTRTLLLAAAAVVVIGGLSALALSLAGRDDTSSLDVVGPDPTTTATDEPDPDGPLEGAMAEHDPAITLEPAGPYTAGQQITLRTPDGYRLDWVNDRPNLCAVVADDPRGPTERCDPLRETGSEAISPTETHVLLSRRIFTPTGYRDCAEPEVTCRLVLMRGDGQLVATEALRFDGDPVTPDTSLAIAAGEDGEFVLDPSGLTAHPSWLAEREDRPDLADQIPALRVSVCAFEASEPDIAPYGQYLWGQGVFHGLLSPDNCDTAPSPLMIDPDEPDRPVTLLVPGRFHGYSGWSDCRVDRCFVQINQTILENESGEPGLAGGERAVAAALVPFDPDATVPPPPSVTISEPGPHRAGDTITVEIVGLPDGRNTNVGICRVEQPWACGYVATTFGVGNGTHQVLLPDTVATCGTEQCYLELDSQGEGLPPLATTPLPIVQE